MRGIILSFLAIGLSSAHAQTYTFLKVADTQTPRSDGAGNFWPTAPTIEGNIVVFNQGANCAGCAAPDSIWAANLDSGAFTKLVDKTQPIPGSGGRWDMFDVKPVLRGGIVVFLGYDSNSKPGLYSVPAAGGAVTRLVDTTMMIPGSTVNFAELVRGGFSHDGRTVVFAARAPAISGVYSVRVDGANLARVADTNTPVNSNQCDAFPSYLFTDPSISNGVIALRGQTTFDSSNGFNALYLGPLVRTVSPGCTAFPSVANSLQKLPTDPTVNFHTRFSYGLLDGQTVYFRADDPNSSYGGIFSAPATATPAGSALTRIVDVNTLLPDFGMSPFTNGYNFAVSQGNVVFRAGTADGKRNGLFVSRGVNLSKLIATDDTLDGYRVRGVDDPTLTGISGADIAFTWDRGDFERELSVARLISTNIAITGVTNAASYAPDSIAPGEVVTVFGTGLGPSGILTAALDANRRVASVLSNARLFFDGIPAPLVYVGAGNGGQSSAIVPYKIDGRTTVTVTAEYQGRLSAPVSMRVAPANPGIYSADSSGLGQGAIQNQDGSYNSAANPAARGTIITIYASGMGQTTPPGVDGEVSGATAPRPSAQISITIGGIAVAPADIVYSAMAPFAVTGLYQMNVRIPQSVPTGDQPVIITAAGVASRPDVTVNVR